LSAEDEGILAHGREQNYLLPYTKVFGQVTCLVNSTPLAVGRAERSWKATKRGIKMLIVFDVQKCIILLSTFLMTKNIVLSN